MARVVVVALLVMSLIANVYLLYSRLGPDAKPPHVASIGPRASAPQAPVLAPRPAVPLRSYALLERRALEQRLADTEAELDKYLPLRLKFERAQRSPETEARARKILDTIFGALSLVPHSYDVECHDSCCKLDVLDSDISRSEWMQQVQTNFAFHGWEFSPDGTYTSLPDPAESARGELISAIVHAYPDSAAIAACAKQFSSTTTAIHVTLDSSHRLTATLDPSFAGTPAGACVRAAMDALLRSVEVPREVQTLDDLPLPFPMPM